MIPALAAAALASACADTVEVGSGAAGEEVAQVSVAQDQSAQAVLRSVLVVAMTAFVENNGYDGVEGDLPAASPGVCVVGSTASATAPSSGCTASVSAFAQGTTFAAATMSQSGHCFWIRTESNAGTTYGSGTPCTGTAALGASSPAFPAA